MYLLGITNGELCAHPPPQENDSAFSCSLQYVSVEFNVKYLLSFGYKQYIYYYICNTNLGTGLLLLPSTFSCNSIQKHEDISQ
jgi:hypothetical protein